MSVFAHNCSFLTPEGDTINVTMIDQEDKDNHDVHLLLHSTSYPDLAPKDNS